MKRHKHARLMLQLARRDLKALDKRKVKGKMPQVRQ